MVLNCVNCVLKVFIYVFYSSTVNMGDFNFHQSNMFTQYLYFNSSVLYSTETVKLAVCCFVLCCILEKYILY